MSNDIRKLEAMTLAGDLEAARLLLREAERSDDLVRASLAAQHLGDFEVTGQIAERLWHANEHAALEALTRAHGFVLDAARAARLSELLTAAHGRRHVRLLRFAQALEAIAEARHTAAGFGFRHGGSTVGSPSNPRTTLCLAARNTAGIAVAVTEASASSPSPGSGWPELSPWRKNDMEGNLARLKAAWARVPLGGLQVEVCDSTAFVPAEPPPAGALESLASALAEEPDEKTFKEVLRILDKWPKAEKATFDAALRMAKTALASWPAEACQAGRAWLGRVLKGAPRPTDILCRDFRPEKLSAAELIALAERPELAWLEQARLARDHDALLTNDALRALGNSPHTSKLAELWLDLPFRPDLQLAPAALLAGSGLRALRTLTLQCAFSSDEAYVAAGLEGCDLPRLDSLSLGATSEALAKLLASPMAGRLRRLRLGSRPGDQAAAILAESPQLANLRWLEVLHLDNEGAAVLGASSVLRHLEALWLRSQQLDSDAVRALVGGEMIRTVRVLRLDDNPLGDAGAHALAEAPLDALQSLGLQAPYNGAKITADGAAALGAAPWMRHLRDLALNANAIGSEGVAALLSGAPEALERLVLNACEIGPEGALAIATNPHLKRLRHLVLSFNPISTAGFVALIQSPHLTALETLEVKDCGIGFEGAEALAASEALPTVRTLLLDSNPLTDKAGAVLARSPQLARLEWLSLHMANMGRKAIEELAGSQFLEGRFTGVPGYQSVGRTVPSLAWLRPELATVWEEDVG